MTDHEGPIRSVRDARERISARFDHDPAKLLEYYLTLQEEFRSRIIESVSQSPDRDQGGETRVSDSRRH